MSWGAAFTHPPEVPKGKPTRFLFPNSPSCWFFDSKAVMTLLCVGIPFVVPKIGWKAVVASVKDGKPGAGQLVESSHRLWFSIFPVIRSRLVTSVVDSSVDETKFNDHSGWDWCVVPAVGVKRVIAFGTSETTRSPSSSDDRLFSRSSKAVPPRFLPVPFTRTRVISLHNCTLPLRNDGWVVYPLLLPLRMVWKFQRLIFRWNDFHVDVSKYLGIICWVNASLSWTVVQKRSSWELISGMQQRIELVLVAGILILFTNQRTKWTESITNSHCSIFLPLKALPFATQLIIFALPSVSTSSRSLWRTNGSPRLRFEEPLASKGLLFFSIMDEDGNEVNVYRKIRQNASG